jgi:hypothetical protein
MEVEIAAKLHASASAEPTAQESAGAKMHRQPTPKSMAAAEVGLADLPAQMVEAVTAAMDRAREADRAGDQSACEAALADAQRALRP